MSKTPVTLDEAKDMLKELDKYVLELNTSRPLERQLEIEYARSHARELAFKIIIAETFKCSV